MSRLAQLLIATCLMARGAAQSNPANVSCTSHADIYIVVSAADSMVDLHVQMGGMRDGLAGWFNRTGNGPNISVCAYGTTAEEQIVPGDPLNAAVINMVGGISHLDWGIECARRSSQKNRRPAAPQYMVLIVGEEPFGFRGDDFTEAAREQIRLARTQEGFTRITLTTVSYNLYPVLIKDFADTGFALHIESDFSEFARRANPADGNNLDMNLWRQYCPDVTCTSHADIYIVVTASDTMAFLMGGMRDGLAGWFNRTGNGPRISVCAYGTTAAEQIVPGDPLNAAVINMVHGISHLDRGIECARRSGKKNRRPAAPQYMVLIVGEDLLGLDGDNFTEAAREQIRLARTQEGFTRITLTTVSYNVYPELIKDFADTGFALHIEGDFSEFARRANPGDGNNLDMNLWRQYCPDPTTVTTTEFYCCAVGGMSLDALVR